MAFHRGLDRERDLERAEKAYNDILTHNPGNCPLLYYLGTLYMEQGKLGLAIQLLSYVSQHEPGIGEAWNNLGLCYRSINDYEKARENLKKAYDIMRENPDIPANLSATYINEGDPKTCIEWCNAALEIDPEHLKAKWHKALALLELQDWKNAWPAHEIRLKSGSASHDIAKRNYHGPDGQTQWWDGRDGEFVVIHGEQGVGDEIMFASCLPDILKMAPNCKFLLECSPRLQGLMQRSFPTIDVRGTDHTDGRDWIEELGKPDKKTALGSLPKFVRSSEDKFPGTPYLIPDPKKVQQWQYRLPHDKPRIGIAWQGGVAKTRVDLRSIFPDELLPILQKDAHFYCLQYTNDAEQNTEMLAEKGIDIKYFSEAQSYDMDDLAPYVASMDLIISVCQTAIHMAGSLGVECWCLTPNKPSWRYGVTGNMPWYNSVDLIRMPSETDNWTDTIYKTSDRLEKWLKSSKLEKNVNLA